MTSLSPGGTETWTWPPTGGLDWNGEQWTGGNGWVETLGSVVIASNGCQLVVGREKVK